MKTLRGQFDSSRACRSFIGACQFCSLLFTIFLVLSLSQNPSHAQSSENSTSLTSSSRSLTPSRQGRQQIYLDDPFAVSNKSIIQKFVDAANRKLAQTLTQEHRTRSIIDACDLYVMMEQNPDVGNSETLTGRKRKLLAVLRRELKELLREQRLAESKNADAPRKERQLQASKSSVELDPLGRSTAVREEEIDSTSQKAFLSEDRLPSEMQQKLAAMQAESTDWELAYRLSSGPAQLLVRSGGATVGDASDLIHLIQTTVTPNVWDINGGPATISYYQRVHALVVRAPWSTHLGTEDLLKRFRD